MSVVLLTNNPRMRSLFSPPDVWLSSAQSPPQVLRTAHADAHTPLSPCVFLEGSTLHVLTLARDHIHAGWKLLNHPLYGNFRPHQQPYRSLLLLHTTPSACETPPDGVARIAPDPFSLHLIEEALVVYRSVFVLTPEKAPPALQDACAVLDYELMRLPLEQSGILSGGMTGAAQTPIATAVRRHMEDAGSQGGSRETRTA